MHQRGRRLLQSRGQPEEGLTFSPGPLESGRAPDPHARPAQAGAAQQLELQLTCRWVTTHVVVHFGGFSASGLLAVGTG